MPPFKSKSGDADFDRVFNGEEGMRQQLLDELMQISEEESKYKAGVATVSSSNFNPFDFIVSLLYFYRRFAVALDKIIYIVNNDL